MFDVVKVCLNQEAKLPMFHALDLARPPIGAVMLMFALCCMHAFTPGGAYGV